MSHLMRYYVEMVNQVPLWDMDVGGNSEALVIRVDIEWEQIWSKYKFRI